MELGFYNHFKGGVYHVVGIALHHETREELVMYYDYNTAPPFTFYAREKKNFEEEVIVNGKKVKRFQKEKYNYEKDVEYDN